MCAHFWKLDTPIAGIPTVAGVCRECGEERTFPAWEPAEWNGRDAALRLRRATYAARLSV